MFRIYASYSHSYVMLCYVMYARTFIVKDNSHSYTHLILALGIVREPTIRGLITSQYPDIHDIGLPRYSRPRACLDHSSACTYTGWQTDGAMNGATQRVSE